MGAEIPVWQICSLQQTSSCYPEIHPSVTTRLRQNECFILSVQDKTYWPGTMEPMLCKIDWIQSAKSAMMRLKVVDYSISWCKVLAPEEYKLKHDGIDQYLHWLICWLYKLKIEVVTEGENIIIVLTFWLSSTYRQNHQR